MPHTKTIRKVAVLGAGVMGAQIAAHFVNANVETLLFELPAKNGDPNENAAQAIKSLRKVKPSPLVSPSRLAYIQPANYEQHLELLHDCDLVIEAIAERIDWKSDLYRKLAPHLSADCIFASNTSGLAIKELAMAFPEARRHCFCGVHFFNPPRYMHLIELISHVDTDVAILDKLEEFLVSTLGKGVIRAKDTPNFIANRIGIFSLLATLHHARRLGLNLDIVDTLTGRHIGRPKSATFRTLDIVGLDIFSHAVDTMHDRLPEDPWHMYFSLPDWLKKLINDGALGQKTKCGVYRKVDDKIFVFDLNSQNYRLSNGKIDVAVEQILRKPNWDDRLSALHASERPQAQFLWAVFRDTFHYCSTHLESIANNARDLDFAIRWGFGWDSGPFEIWQAAGWQKVLGWLNDDISAGKTMSSTPLPQWAIDPTRSKIHTPQGSYSPSNNEYQPRSILSIYNRQEFPEQLLGEVVQYGETIFETENVRMWHTGKDGIAILSFKTKMHIISNELLDDILRALNEAEESWLALIIWQASPPFSAGANLLQLMQGVQPPNEKKFNNLKNAAQRIKYTIASGGGLGELVNAATGKTPHIEDTIIKFQLVSQRLKYAQVPTIAAVDGLALGGGCEISIHCTRIVAALESYFGLVETGVGLLPSGGGCKEMAHRAAQMAGGGNVFPFIRHFFQNISMGEVSQSAEFAREMGYLRVSDRIVMNHFELLYAAKNEALSLTRMAYRPPLMQYQIPVAGRTGIASLKASMINMLEGGFISEHDYAIGCRVAEVMCGGDIDTGSMVDEQWFLDLERRNFIELLAMDKTQERIEHMLKYGKPLRN